MSSVYATRYWPTLCDVAYRAYAGRGGVGGARLERASSLEIRVGHPPKGRSGGARFLYGP
jgi:hypothetical protein